MRDNRQNILDNTNNGLAIFEYYIPQLKESGTAKNFKALFRDDGHSADANVFVPPKSSTWCYHDFVTGENLNPFDFVMKLRDCDFKEAIAIISKDMLMDIPVTSQKKVINTSAIENFNLVHGNDYSYWLDYVTESAIMEVMSKFKVQALDSFTFTKGNKQFRIAAKASDPLFGFQISDTCCKIYRPMPTGKQVKHLWLGKKPESYHDLYGMDLLPENTEFILIVEGLKDAIVANAHGIVAVGADNAATRLQAEDVELLQKKCQHLIVCYDIDLPGKTGAMKTASEHGLHNLILPETLISEGGKDLSDFFKLGHAVDEVFQLVQATIRAGIVKKIDQPQTEERRLSKFEKVEQLISETYDLRYNEVSSEIEFKLHNSDVTEHTPLNEDNVYRFLQHNNIEFSMSKLSSLLRSDYVSRFNPFKYYFEHLPEWLPKSDPDYIQTLCGYIPVQDSVRFEVQFRKTLVRTIACALTDTTINKQALILVHEEQNSGKTTFIRWLCPNFLSKYIAENISTDKDSLIALSDNLMINMDELATLSRAEINSLKSMFSKETIKVRRPYDKTASSAPRRASFFGSTNKAEFLTDETGSVRWLCFDLTGRINWDYKKDINIDDVWRQAYTLYKTGFKYELTADEIESNEKANQQYQVTTTEIELIQKHYTPGTKELHDAFYQATDFLTNLVEKYPAARLNTSSIGKALKLLGFERVCKRSDKYPVKGYFMQFAETSVQNGDYTTTPF